MVRVLTKEIWLHLQVEEDSLFLSPPSVDGDADGDDPLQNWTVEETGRMIHASPSSAG